MIRRPPAPDQAERDRAIRERAGNVIVDAGAGTGKTTLLVDRLVSMIAPEDGSAPCPLSAIAAITFTRKAAGELKLRVRERLLAELAEGATGVRRELLARALAEADTAWIGTIHGFADRLLRRHPVEARLGASWEVVEEVDALVAETWELLLQAAEAGRLEEELAGSSCTPAQARAAEEAIRLGVAAEIRTATWEGEWSDRVGLDRLVAGFLLHRDHPPPETHPARFEHHRIFEALHELAALARRSHGTERGSRWLARAAKRAEELAEVTEPAVLYRELMDFASRTPKLTKKRDFVDDEGGWKAWKAWTKEHDDGPPLLERATGPLHRWMATRLVQLFPAAVALYGKVKARHRVVDQVDLLLELRDLLRDRPDVRARTQSLFRHLFVDEFQDTDPLQAEIVLFLCEDGARAKDWREVALAPGRLTLVGDPKQSIYRFRRADIAIYEAVRAIVRRGPHVVATLVANFRTDAALLEHLNDRFDHLLGKHGAGAEPFDVAHGTVANQRLLAGRPASRGKTIVALRVATREEDDVAARERALEGAALAAWIRQAVDGGRTEVIDPATGQARPLRFGDVAVLAHSTWNVALLIERLDRLGIPWSARGGSLFLQDALHRQLLLGLRAVADRDDGVAQAALFRPPFFALDLGDLARARAAGDAESDDEGIARARSAKALVEALRRDRHSRPPGQTARDLLERTGFARAVAFGPNGAQRLERLRELCLEVERIADEDGLDFDGVTARLRAWALDPVALDPPRPVGGDAVQVMTIHQAKGLEFPVVAWWDGHAKLAPSDRQEAWFVARTGEGWAMKLDGLEWEEPAGSGLLAREKLWLGGERKRLVYVAATRARDLLVLPLSKGTRAPCIPPVLLGDVEPPSPTVELLEEASDGALPHWAARAKAPRGLRPRVAKGVATEVDRAWAEAARESGKARHVPTGVSTEAHRVADAEREGDAGGWGRAREGRFGPLFGETVHAAIGVALRDPALSADAAVARAARDSGLDANLAEAARDVGRALAALAREGLRIPPGETLRLEYPVACARGSALLVGYVDLLAARGDERIVLDFKTDAPPRGDVAQTHPAYVEQVRSYARILVDLGVAREGQVQAGLLFTADGGIRWT